MMAGKSELEEWRWGCKAAACTPGARALVFMGKESAFPVHPGSAMGSGVQNTPALLQLPSKMSDPNGVGQAIPVPWVVPANAKHV